MEYTVLARRFRPQAFGEVIGQERVAQALRNAIAAGRVAHAYLFTGARGVGKTSMARILAKSLNCPNVHNGDPCNECDICEKIAAGSDIDVLEIDGASNRGIEDIRTLRANVNVRSMRSPYKIYIIDEVHMLTREAFNALLKTLEEPPPNVKFVFCTTEPQKVPDTILSRCQRFDFGTIATGSIMDRLTQIASLEGVEVEKAAVELVARRAAGSMRDSQSLFDQLLAFGGTQVSTADVHRLLGTAPDERLIDLVQALLERRRDLALELFDGALRDGVQLSEFTDQLVGYFRDLMVLATGAKEVTLVSVADEHRPALAKQAQTWGLQTILAALQIWSECKQRMRGVTFGRALAELALVRVSLLEDLDMLSQLLQQMKTGKPLAVTVNVPAGHLPGASGPALAGSAASGTASASSVPAGPRAPSASTLPLPSSSAEIPPAASAQTSSRPASEADRSSNPRSTPAGENQGIGGRPAPAGAPRSVEQNADNETVIQTREFLPLEPGTESRVWSQVLDTIRDIKDMGLTAAKQVSRVAISGPNQLVLYFPKGYDVFRQQLERGGLSKLEAILKDLVGRLVRIGIAVDDSRPVEIPPPPPKQNGKQSDLVVRRGEEINDPLVNQVKEEFAATVVDVKWIPTTSDEASGGR